jgi:hypothetical protein
MVFATVRSPDDEAVGFLLALLTGVVTCGLLVPAIAVAHLRGWLSAAPAAMSMALLLVPGTLVGLGFPAFLPVPTLGLAYAGAVFALPDAHLKDAAAHAFPASGELRSIRASWAYLPGALRLSVQVAAYLVLVIGSACVAGLTASGLLGIVAAPGTAGAAALVSIVAGLALVGVVLVMAIVGVPPLLLLSPLGGFTRARVQRWVTARAGVTTRSLSWWDHLALAALGVLATVIGGASLIVSIAGIGVASLGAGAAMPGWVALAAVLGVRSHLAEILVHPVAGGRRGLVRRHLGELTLASLFQLLALTWLVGMAAFVGAAAGGAALGTAAGTWPTMAWLMIGLAVTAQTWVTLRSLVTLALLRVVFVQELALADGPDDDPGGIPSSPVRV